MGNTTMVNYQCVKSNSEKHNQKEWRIEKYDYIRADLTSQNEQFVSASIQEKWNEAEANYIESTRQKPQYKKWEPIHEAVVIIKEDTSMDELKALADKFKDEFGINTFQINIHKDEGRWEDKKTWVPNYHAHFVSDFTHQKGEMREVVNKKTGEVKQIAAGGKRIKLLPGDFSRMQDLAAETLGMSRGESKEKTNRVHLNAHEYKSKVRAITSQIKSNKTLSKAEIAKLTAQGKLKETYNKVIKQNHELLNNQIVNLTKLYEYDDLKADNLNKSKSIDNLLRNKKDLEIALMTERNEKTSALKELGETKKMTVSLEDKIEHIRLTTKEYISEKEKTINRLKNKLSATKGRERS